MHSNGFLAWRKIQLEISITGILNRQSEEILRKQQLRIPRSFTPPSSRSVADL